MKSFKKTKIFMNERRFSIVSVSQLICPLSPNIAYPSATVHRGQGSPTLESVTAPLRPLAVWPAVPTRGRAFKLLLPGCPHLNSKMMER